MKRALLAAALLAATLPALPVAAQTAITSTPVGISVSATASVTPTAFIEQIQFERKASGSDTDGARAVAQFRDVLGKEGVPSTAILAATPYTAPAAASLPGLAASLGGAETIAIAALRIEPDRLTPVIKALAAIHWTPAAGARVMPVDEESLREAALTKATAIARQRAAAIAASEGRHIGKLLNVVPEPLDFLESVFEDLSQLSPMFGTSAVPEVKAGGIFTFELLP